MAPRKASRRSNLARDEAARTIGAAKGTVRLWLDKGLPAIRDRKPILILGADLADHMAKQARPKRACPPGTCYCVKCRDARQPDGGMAEFVAINSKSGNLRALCPECGSLMHRRKVQVANSTFDGFEVGLRILAELHRHKNLTFARLSNLAKYLDQVRSMDGLQFVLVRSKNPIRELFVGTA